MKDLREIWQRAQSGDRVGARRRLVRILQEEPRNVRAWALLATLLTDPAQQAECYRRILRIDPNNRRAAASLASLETGSGLIQTCPNCGAPLEPGEGATCPYCGTTTERGIALPDPFAEDFDGDGIPDVTFEAPTWEDLEAYIEDAGEATPKRVKPPSYSALAQFVVDELSGHQSRRYIVREICLRSEMNWEEAKAFVAEVEQVHQREIAKRRSPITLLISGSVLIIGMASLAYSLHNLTITARVFMESEGLQMEPLMWGLSELWNLLPGLAMVLGGLFGLGRMFVALQTRDDE